MGKDISMLGFDNKSVRSVMMMMAKDKVLRYSERPKFENAINAPKMSITDPMTAPHYRRACLNLSDKFGERILEDGESFSLGLLQFGETWLNEYLYIYNYELDKTQRKEFHEMVELKKKKQLFKVHKFWNKINKEQSKLSFPVDRFDYEHYRRGPARVVPAVSLDSNTSRLSVIGYGLDKVPTLYREAQIIVAPAADYVVQGYRLPYEEMERFSSLENDVEWQLWMIRQHDEQVRPTPL
jgi:hypothetical protein